MTDIEETRLNLRIRKHAQALIDQAPSLLSMIGEKMYEIDHPWRSRMRKFLRRALKRMDWHQEQYQRKRDGDEER